MSRRVLITLLAGLMVGVMIAPVSASPPDKFEAPSTFGFPDYENGLAVFINTSRDAECTEEVMAWEHEVADWVAGGFNGPPPPEPEFTPGIELVSIKLQETGQGAIVGHISESDLYMEVWTLDDPENQFGVGPCTDTDDQGTFLASGSTSYKGQDNDVFGSRTRGNSFGNQGKASLTDTGGNDWSYKWKFHLNYSCHVPEFGPPACLSEPGTLTAK